MALFGNPSFNVGSAIGNLASTLGSTTNRVIPTAISGYTATKSAGAGMANAVSQMAQNNQFAFNSAEAALQREYNEQIWNETAAFNSAEAAANRAYQSQEAQTNREWQEKMSSTAYQRAVEDLKKAGLNPILAAFSGGAGIGSGAMGSGSQASVSPTSGAAASGSNYSGQGFNISDELAIFGALGNLAGEAMSAFGSYMSKLAGDTDNNLSRNYSGNSHAYGDMSTDHYRWYGHRINYNTNYNNGKYNRD